jgi:hypothetical protein
MSTGEEVNVVPCLVPLTSIPRGDDRIDDLSIQLRVDFIVAIVILISTTGCRQ